MPGTNAELVQLADGEGYPEDFRWIDGTELTPEEWLTVLGMRLYLARMRRDKAKDRRSQRTALRLLRSLLTPGQRAQLRSGSVVVTVASGNAYRLLPRFGHVERVTRNGRRWFVFERYCLHDVQDEDAMPPGDLSIAHLLLLLTDEAAFLAMANAHTCRDQLWNREYLRRMRRRHAVPMEVAG